MKLTGIIIILYVVFSCGSSKTEKQEQVEFQSGTQITEFEFLKEMYNFGTLQAGEIGIFTFTFTNTGDNNLWINEVETGCGCVTVKYEEEPVNPGENGEIEIEFDTSGLYGKQMKTITVEANVSNPKHLTIFADVNNEQLEIKY